MGLSPPPRWRPQEAASQETQRCTCAVVGTPESRGGDTWPGWAVAPLLLLQTPITRTPHTTPARTTTSPLGCQRLSAATSRVSCVISAPSVHESMGCVGIASGRSNRCKPARPGCTSPRRTAGQQNGGRQCCPAQLRAQGGPQTHGASCSAHSPAHLRPTPRGGARHVAGARTARAGARGPAERDVFQRRASPRPTRSRRIWSPISREVCCWEPCTPVEAMHAVRNQLRSAGGVRPHPRRLCTLPWAAAPHKRRPCSCLRPRSCLRRCSCPRPQFSSRPACPRRPSTCSGTTWTQ